MDQAGFKSRCGYNELRNTHVFTRYVYITWLFNTALTVVFPGLSITPAQALTLESNLTLSPGLRYDDFDFNIAGNTAGASPNILSELKWRKIKSAQLQLGSEILLNRRFYFKGYANSGYIFKGDNQDSDYFGDNRTLEFSRSNNDAGQGKLLDAGVAFGILFRLYDSEAKSTLAAIPQIGYSSHVQKFTIRDGYQTIPALGPFPGLDSTYKTQWSGPWFGFDLRFQASYESALVLRYEYHQVQYYGVGNWNLRADFKHPKSFEHEADGTGTVLALGWRKELEGDWLIGVDLQWQNWTTEHGTDVTYFSDNTVFYTQLNEVNWSSRSFTFIFGKFFTAL